jgi:hypothetical protein
MPPNPENLIPAKPGEVRNPKGINQYTYRDQAKRDLQAWCKANGKDFVEMLAEKAKDGEGWAAQLLWKELLPPESKHELAAHLSGAVEVTREGEWTELAGGIRRLKSNGRDLPAGKGNGGADPGDSS